MALAIWKTAAQVQPWQVSNVMQGLTIHTYEQCRIPLTAWFWTAGRVPEQNSHTERPECGVKLRTFFLWCNISNHRAAIPS